QSLSRDFSSRDSKNNGYALSALSIFLRTQKADIRDTKWCRISASLMSCALSTGKLTHSAKRDGDYKPGDDRRHNVILVAGLRFDRRDDQTENNDETGLVPPIAWCDATAPSFSGELCELAPDHNETDDNHDGAYNK
ncbi:hypothetical protein M1555_00005, partial [Patescibacteria group bacterium]|nr:hypothetical protein [Patescibacteria group bacterium]